ncbi:MAG TPA: SDR family oxidoreductase [Geminicoccus sp.]|uniref:SDR family NAD(P)-dependent oxidoreductase n=1 Tax=Geminicoccus TaxID=489140 RepID=UPI00168A49B3|nr:MULTISPECIES: SDR family oxidoreductase [Geminicoccus]HWL71713.1 SDR family oxidoreductase [Geminicoccus sp.]
MQDQKVVFITGASRGIGHATAKYFVKQGWRAVTCSRDAVPPQCGRGERHMHICADLADLSKLPEVVAELEDLLDGGPIHALVNNAGYSPKGEDGHRLGALESDLDVFQKVFAINFFSCAWFAREMAPKLAETSGAIVNITSIAGSRVHPFAGTAYATSKAALTALTRELAADLAHLRIRVNAVSPGEINTAILSPGTEALVERIPMRRLGSPEEVAAVVHYLCSDQVSYITGAEIPVNGGQDVY